MPKKLLPLSTFSNFTALALFYPLNVRSTALVLFCFLKEGSYSEKDFSLPFSPFENLVIRIRVLNQGNRYTSK